jgi:ketosteroid isomerase-like protein
MDTVSPDQLSRMVVKSEIEDALFRYCHAVDRCDVDLMKSVYHPDATDNHGIFNGPAADFAEYMIPRLEHWFSSTQHHITNVLVEIHGDTAYVESYFLSFHRWRDDFNRDNTSAGRYVDRFERRNGRWLIAHRQLLIDWTADQVNLEPTQSAAMFLWGARREDDASAERLPEHQSN